MQEWSKQFDSLWKTALSEGEGYRPDVDPGLSLTSVAGVTGVLGSPVFGNIGEEFEGRSKGNKRGPKGKGKESSLLAH